MPSSFTYITHLLTKQFCDLFNSAVGIAMSGNDWKWIFSLLFRPLAFDPRFFCFILLESQVIRCSQSGHPSTSPSINTEKIITINSKLLRYLYRQPQTRPSHVFTRLEHPRRLSTETRFWCFIVQQSIKFRFSLMLLHFPFAVPLLFYFFHIFAETPKIIQRGISAINCLFLIPPRDLSMKL